MPGVSLCTLVPYPLQVGDRKLALHSVHHVVQGVSITDHTIRRHEVRTQIFGDPGHVEEIAHAAGGVWLVLVVCHKRSPCSEVQGTQGSVVMHRHFYQTLCSVSGLLHDACWIV